MYIAASHKGLWRDLIVGLGKEKGQERPYSNYVHTPSPSRDIKIRKILNSVSKH
jgi:hypothetical protein